MTDKRIEHKGRILFCGAFQRPSNGTVGGVLYACRSLLDTTVAKQVSWELIDSAQSLPPPPFVSRLLNAIERIGKSVYCLLFRNIQGTLIFSPFLTFSLLEKLSICLLSSLIGKPTCIAFRSEIRIHNRVHWVLYPLLKFALKRVTCVICQSEEAKRALKVLFPTISIPMEVIPNWTSLEAQRPKLQLRASSNEKVNRITYIGWLEPIKDVGTILSALSLIEEELGTWEFVICGSGSQEHPLKVMADRLGLGSRVQFLGWVNAEDKRDILENTDLLVMASLSEGMPNALVEAMSYGVPVVSSNAGGIPSLVRHESGGLLFPPGDARSASEAMLRMLHDAEFRQRCGDYNRRQIESEHDAEKSMKKILSLLKIDVAFSDN